MAENGRVIVTGCFGVEKPAHLAAHPGVLAVTGPHQYEEVVDAVHEPCRRCTIPSRSRAAGGPAADAAALRLSEDFRRLQQPLLASASFRRCAAIWRAARSATSWPRPNGSSGRRQGAARHQPGHERLRPRPQDMPRACGSGKPLKARFLELSRALGTSAPGCGCTTSIPIRMSTMCIPLMAEGKILPYLDIPFQHASPARAESDAPSGARRRRRWSASALARDLPRSRDPLDLHRRLSGRDGGGFRIAARLAAARPSSLASDASSTRPSKARRQTRSPVPCRKR